MQFDRAVVARGREFALHGDPGGPARLRPRPAPVRHFDTVASASVSCSTRARATASA